MLNWSGNVVFAAKRIRQPRTLAELQTLVAETRHLRAVGSRHSFSAIADSPGLLVDLSLAAEPPRIDAAAKTVTITGPTRYRELALALDAAGFALENLPSFTQLTVVGAIMTGTHGSGDAHQGLAASVVSLDIVGADGAVRTIARGQSEYDVGVVSLGALGVVARMTLAIEPSFTVRTDPFVDLPWPATREAFDAIMAAGDSVSLMTHWSSPAVEKVWVKTRTARGTRGEAALAQGASAAWDQVPALDDDLTPRLNPFRTDGPWHERLPHMRHDMEPGPIEQIQSEILVPRDKAIEAFAVLRRLAKDIDRTLIVGEVRTVKGDKFWMSPAYGADMVAFHFTWRKEPQAVDSITLRIEDNLRRLGGRPHWGKVMHSRPDQLASVYPRFEDFRDHVRFHDPEGKFRNPFLATHVFGGRF
jgi:alditol oxidase